MRRILNWALDRILKRRLNGSSSRRREEAALVNPTSDRDRTSDPRLKITEKNTRKSRETNCQEVKMGLIKWFRREKIRRRARKEIKHAREAAPGTRQGQRALARKIEKIRAKANREIDKHR